MKELFEKKQDWADSEVQQIEYSMLKGILGCRTTEAVEAAITYASYLNFTGITNGNYPVFLNILTVRNHHVIDALLGTRDPFLFMSSIQPNYFIVSTCFAILTKYRKAEITPRPWASSWACSRPRTTRPSTATRSIRRRWPT